MKREFQHLQTVQRRRRLGKGKLASILSKSSCGNFLQIFSSMLEQEFSSSSEPSKWWEECGRQAINERGSIKSASLYTPGCRSNSSIHQFLRKQFQNPTKQIWLPRKHSVLKVSVRQIQKRGQFQKNTQTLALKHEKPQKESITGS
jgi:hypothetical protein